MKKSMLPLLITFVFVVLLTILMIGHKFTRLQDDESISFKPFRIATSKPPTEKQGNSEEVISRQELVDKIDEALQKIEDDQIDDAEDTIRTVLLFAPDNIKAMTIMGRIMYVKGKFQEAETLFRRQLSYTPVNSTTMNNLASTLARQGKIIEALNYAYKAAELSPNTPEIILNLAGLEALSGNRDKAVKHFRQAGRLFGPVIVSFSEDPCFDSIRHTREFKAVLRSATAPSPTSPKKPSSPAVTTGGQIGGNP